MHIDFNVTPEANLRALIAAQNPELVISDIEFSEPTDISSEGGERNTTVTISGIVDGVYEDQTAQVTYNRRDIAGSDITVDPGEFVLEHDLKGNSEGVIAYVSQQVVQYGNGAYIDVTYDPDYDEAYGLVTFTPKDDAEWCLFGKLEVAVMFDEPPVEGRSLDTDLEDPALNGFVETPGD